MKISRREFLQRSTRMSAAALIGGAAGGGALSGCFWDDDGDSVTRSHPNVLLIMVDQMRTPPEGYKSGEGAVQGLKEILGFRPLSPDNEYTAFFPGLLRLRRNAVVLRTHYTASAACTPSRACIMTGQYASVTGVTDTDQMFKTRSSGRRSSRRRCRRAGPRPRGRRSRRPQCCP